MTTTHELASISIIDSRNIWQDEVEDFTPWLAENISEFGEALGLELEPDSTSVGVPVGSHSLDMLAYDVDRQVAIEIQLGETNDVHLGELLTCMAGRGVSVAVWVASKFNDEHTAALDLLNQRTDEETEFYGVVVEVWQIDGSRPAPHFKVVAAPNDWRTHARASNWGGNSEIIQRYRLYFQGLIYGMGEGPDVPRSRRVTGRRWQSFTSGYPGVEYRAAFATRQGERCARVELYLDSDYRDTNKDRFDQLEDSREEIEAQVGGDFEWERLDSRRASRISVVRPGSIRDNDAQLDQIREWMSEKLVTFKRCFDPRLADILS